MQILLLGEITMNTIRILVPNVVLEIGHKYCILRTLYCFIPFFLLLQFNIRTKKDNFATMLKKNFVSVLKGCVNFFRTLGNYFSSGEIPQKGSKCRIPFQFRNHVLWLRP